MNQIKSITQSINYGGSEYDLIPCPEGWTEKAIEKRPDDVKLQVCSPPTEGHSCGESKFEAGYGIENWLKACTGTRWCTTKNNGTCFTAVSENNEQKIQINKAPESGGGGGFVFHPFPSVPPQQGGVGFVGPSPPQGGPARETNKKICMDNPLNAEYHICVEHQVKGKGK
jgi:hypothetical protein